MKTDDLLKALKQCSANVECRGCPLGSEAMCRQKLLAYALETINRQKAEIEKLRKENTELKDGYFQKRNEEIEHQELMCLRNAWRKSNDQNMDLQLENEGLQAENKEQDQAIINALHRMGQIRAEAIKEFAERLKRRHLRLRPCFGIVRCCLSETDIDHLVKEITEDTK